MDTNVLFMAIPKNLPTKVYPNLLETIRQAFTTAV